MLHKLYICLFTFICVFLPGNLLFGQNLKPDYYDRLDAFLAAYVHDGLVDYALVKRDQATSAWVTEIASAGLEETSPAERQAFLINAYNLLVIHAVAEAYPVNSVLDLSGFFDQKKYAVAGQSMTLNELEKTHLLKEFGDPRFHFVLVCGAVDCPPIADKAYRPERLEQQLEVQTRAALNDPNFIRVTEDQQKASLSQIFEWYASDFGGSKSSALAYINRYRRPPINAGAAVTFYPYDWSLNGQKTSSGSRGEEADGREATPLTAEAVNVETDANTEPDPANADPANPDPANPDAANAIRYVVSATIPKGQVETKIFNNLYTQTTGDGSVRSDRSTFFTTFITSLYGVNDRFNAGLEVRYRRVRNEALPASPFSVLGSGEMAQTRQAVTTIGPKIRWAPVPKWSNFSVQSAVWLPLGREFEGENDQPYIDWSGPAWWTQFFNDFALGSRFSLFTEIDFLWEDIGRSEAALNRISTPATVILSYFPHPKTTLYTLGSYSPYWHPSYDYFAQAGLGAKQQVNRKLEFELLYTFFTNDFLWRNGGRAATFNLGVRFNLG
ncbi:MAG: DUF547 domain-containing protein [Cryomorphaceae bacterium]|nr:DUF547 domain-containing protein [Cryomorphaceae bacterium]